MSYIRKQSGYRKIYEQHFGKIPKDELGRSFHIHHKDGNSENNSPDNLEALSAKDHYELHKRQGDHYAAFCLARYLKLSKEEMSELSKQNAQKSLLRGSNHFLKGDNASKAGKKGIQHVKDNGWSEEAINKRVETRKNKDNYSQDMDAANTPEAIRKRVETRKKNGGYLPSFKSRIRESLVRLCNHYQSEFSYDLLVLGRRKKVCKTNPENVKALFSEEELQGLWSRKPQEP